MKLAYLKNEVLSAISRKKMVIYYYYHYWCSLISVCVPSCDGTEKNVKSSSFSGMK